MTSMIFWIFTLTLYLVFRQEVSKYFAKFNKYPFLTVGFCTALMSYFSIRGHDEINGFLIVILYHMNHLKIMIQNLLPYHASAFFVSYIFHTLMITGLLVFVLVYEDRHQSMIHREQVLLVQKITYTLLLCFILIASMDMI